MNFIIMMLALTCESKLYTNYTLYRAVPMTERHLKFFNNFTKFFDVNMWIEPGRLYRPIEFTVSPNDVFLITEEAAKEGIYLTVLQEDIQSAFDKQKVNTYTPSKLSTYNWRGYYRLQDMYSWMDDLKNVYPDIVEISDIGSTYEKRTIKAVSVNLNKSIDAPKVIVEGGIHAREWIAPAFVTYLIYSILNAAQSKNKHLAEVAESYEWHFVPVLNPDGYEYTHTQDRLWKKNRQIYGKSWGVDLNKNFDIAFGTNDASRDPDSNNYCGPTPFSESETKAMKDFVRKHSENLEYYLAFHAYGQNMIIPYSHLKTHNDNYLVVLRKCERAAAIINEKRRETVFSSGTGYEITGRLSSGASACWVKKTFGPPVVVTFRLGDGGFAIPIDTIKPTIEDNIAGIVTLLLQSDKNDVNLSKRNVRELKPKITSRGKITTRRPRKKNISGKRNRSRGRGGGGGGGVGGLKSSLHFNLEMETYTGLLKQ